MSKRSYKPHPLSIGLPTTGPEIEKRSFEMIEKCIEGLRCTEMDARIIKRIVHATADVSIAKTIRITPDAVAAGVDALRNKEPIFTDVRMLQVGITRVPSEVRCAITDEQVYTHSKQHPMTRSAAAMELFGEQLAGSIVAIGNAPTAIWKLLELHAAKGITPALVVGLPVGFVGASESKQALWESGLTCITNSGPRGGSPLAAAALNAVAIMERNEN